MSNKIPKATPEQTKQLEALLAVVGAASVWDEFAYLPVSDWRMSVQNDETRASYREAVRSKLDELFLDWLGAVSEGGTQASFALWLDALCETVESVNDSE